MTVEERYRERYRSGDTPWDIGQPDFNLIEVVTKNPILKFFHYNQATLDRIVQIHLELGGV
jgi:hypothetical protein